MTGDKVFTLEVDRKFHKDVMSLADVIIDSDSFSHRYVRLEDAVDDVLMILLELWLMDASDGMDMLIDFLTEVDGGLEYAEAAEIIGRLSECQPREYPCTSESIDILLDHFEYTDTLPERLPIQTASFNPSGAFLFVRTMDTRAARR